MVVLSSFIWVSYEKPSFAYCVMWYFWWGCRRNLTLITRESKGLKPTLFISWNSTLLSERRTDRDLSTVLLAFHFRLFLFLFHFQGRLYRGTPFQSPSGWSSPSPHLLRRACAREAKVTVALWNMSYSIACNVIFNSVLYGWIFLRVLQQHPIQLCTALCGYWTLLVRELCNECFVGGWFFLWLWLIVSLFVG